MRSMKWTSKCAKTCKRVATFCQSTVQISITITTNIMSKAIRVLMMVTARPLPTLTRQSQSKKITKMKKRKTIRLIDRRAKVEARVNGRSLLMTKTIHKSKTSASWKSTRKSNEAWLNSKTILRVAITVITMYRIRTRHRTPSTTWT